MQSNGDICICVTPCHTKIVQRCLSFHHKAEARPIITAPCTRLHALTTCHYAQAQTQGKARHSQSIDHGKRGQATANKGEGLSA